MQAYAIQNSQGLIKLDAMENPFALPPHLQEALGARLGHVALNRYPATAAAEVVEALSRHFSLPQGCAMMVGNGSDELIDLLHGACGQPHAVVLAPVPGFVMYEMSAHLRRLQFVGVPLNGHFQLDVPAMLQAIEVHRPAITYLACPNNPTANLFHEADMLAVVQAVGQQKGLVVVDEAYQPFASRNHWGWLGVYEHVLVMRTLSKWGLAGVRLGYLSGMQALIHEVNKVRPPYNISALNAQATLFALENAKVFEEQAQVIVQQRAWLHEALAARAGVQVFPSQANMILVRVRHAARVFDALKTHGVLVKHVGGLHPLLTGCLRLTVGTPDENVRMLAALDAALESVS